MRPQATVGEITEADIADVAEFLARQARPGEAVTANPLPPVERLRWLLLDNPARIPGIPLGWRIRGESNAIVGAALCLPFRIGALDFLATALMFAKFYVDEAYRGMGAGLLLRFVREGRRFPLFVTSTNAVSGELFARLGATQIEGLDHAMLASTSIAPLAEEFFYRKFASPALARLLALPARLLRSKSGRATSRACRGEFIALQSADEAAAINLPPATNSLAVVRDRDYLHWRYFSGENDKSVFCYRLEGEQDRLVVINYVRSGYRGQIRVLNVLDIWPPTTPAVARALVTHLYVKYYRDFDTLWLRSQPPEVEEALQSGSESLIRHEFPAPLGWFIDSEKRLPTDQWYLMPGESE